jgi:hypothetical protein
VPKREQARLERYRETLRIDITATHAELLASGASEPVPTPVDVEGLTTLMGSLVGMSGPN